jgi:hypothetical protein
MLKYILYNLHEFTSGPQSHSFLCLFLNAPPPFQRINTLSTHFGFVLYLLLPPDVTVESLVLLSRVRIFPTLTSFLVDSFRGFPRSLQEYA